MQLLEALRIASERMVLDFEHSNLFKHSGDKGKFREQIIAKFLRPFLPKCFGIGSGQVFSAAGPVSDQVDIVVFDELFSNVLFRDYDNHIFPCESVYGTIEVKSVLTTDELEKSISNIASVKRLERAATDMFDITPTSKITISGDITFSQSHASNPYVGIVFAYDGLVPETVITALEAKLAAKEYPAELLPNYIFLYKRGVTILRAVREGATCKVTPPGQPFNAYAQHPSGKDILPLFFLTLNANLNSIRLRAPDFSQRPQ
jgi:hypothetical protein